LGTTLRSPRFRLALARAAVLLGVVVLACVPTLARMGQRLETSTHAPSFRNIDSPPKKLTIAPATVLISAIPLEGIETVRVAAFQPPPFAPPSPSPFLSTPTPLRAPPSLLFA
jgi:hypothetical protein